MGLSYRIMFSVETKWARTRFNPGGLSESQNPDHSQSSALLSGFKIKSLFSVYSYAEGGPRNTVLIQ